MSNFSDWRSLNTYYFDGEIQLRFDVEEGRVYFVFKQPRKLSEFIYWIVLLLFSCAFTAAFLIIRPPIFVVACTTAIIGGGIFFATLRERVFFELQAGCFVREITYLGGAIAGFSKSVRLFDPTHYAVTREKQSDIGENTSIFVEGKFLTQIRGEFDTKVLLEMLELISFVRSHENV